MSKVKLSLGDLKVESFVTSLNQEEMSTIKGGIAKVSGRRNTYVIRWTAVDTRVQPDQIIPFNSNH